jgi:hypothetical protein
MHDQRAADVRLKKCRDRVRQIILVADRERPVGRDHAVAYMHLRQDVSRQRRHGGDAQAADRMHMDVRLGRVAGVDIGINWTWGDRCR